MLSVLHPRVNKFDGDDNSTVHMARYYSQFNQAVVIVAVVHDRGENRGDWASYIAGMPAGEFPNYEAAMVYAAKHGAKLEEADARYYFNDKTTFADWPTRLGYRR